MLLYVLLFLMLYSLGGWKLRGGNQTPALTCREEKYFVPP